MGSEYRVNSSDGVIAELASRVKEGDSLALARAISIVENDRPGAGELLSRIQAGTGQAHRVGITGPPGAGKSTLVDKIALRLRKAGKTIGIVAVDPSSPFSGGALLGDRIRMSELVSDPGVFIRSMASRGARGGLALTTAEVCDILDGSGKDVVLVETVGAGQLELDVAETVDTTVVVLVPESGDSVQTMKAGLMEVGDIFVVNKADRPEAEKTQREIQAMIEMGLSDKKWTPPVILAAAREGKGVDEVISAIDEHFGFSVSHELLGVRRRRRVERRLRRMVAARVAGTIFNDSQMQEFLDELIEETMKRDLSIEEASVRLLERAGLMKWMTQRRN
jgi:LAO/AO transport system kinase